MPGQNVSNHLQTSMLSEWQIVSLDYSEWIDAVGYADLDGRDYHLDFLSFVNVLFLGTVWVARGDSSAWSQNNPKFRPSTVRTIFIIPFH